MRHDALLQRVADHLRLTIASPLAGGEFGAVAVRDDGGRDLVLKALPSPAFEARFARGAACAMRMRSLGYPAPEYLGTGVALDATWSLQERLPGVVPERPSAEHIRQLVALAERHAGAAEGRRDTRTATLKSLDRWRATIASHPKTLRYEAAIVATITSDDVILRDGDVMHRDFHHRNFLAEGGEVTGVFDWEQAAIGDWRADLVTLAFWCAVLPEDLVPREAGRFAIERAEEVCPPSVLAFFSASLAARQLDYDVREHPDRLDAITEGIEQFIVPWWRRRG